MLYRCVGCGKELIAKRYSNRFERVCNKCGGHMKPIRPAVSKGISKGKLYLNGEYLGETIEHDINIDIDKKETVHPKHSKLSGITVEVNIEGYDKAKQQLRNLEATFDRILEKQEKIKTISIKPPLGLTPNDIWRLQRLQDIKKAMGRYAGVDKEIPEEWIKEYIYLKNLIR